MKYVMQLALCVPAWGAALAQDGLRDELGPDQESRAAKIRP